MLPGRRNKVFTGVVMTQRDLQEKQGIFRLRYTKKGGQISLVMILVLIIALVLLALSINWKTVASSKWKTIYGATVGSSQIASNYASYAYMLAETYLEGQKRKKSCEINALLVVAILSGGEIFAMIGAWAFEKRASGIVKSWNSQQVRTGSQPEDWVQGGSTTALTMAVDDNDTVYDFSDADSDGNFCSISNYALCKARVARSIAYAARRSGAYLRPTVGSFATFKNALRDLLDELGLLAYDDTSCSACQEHPEKCDPCCVQASSRPSTCATDGTSCLSSAVTSYDPLYCAKQDPESFVGFWGKTDMDSKTMKTIANDPSASLITDPDKILRGADTEGQIFPLQSLIKDTAMNVAGLNAGSVHQNDEECMWCAEQAVGTCQASGNTDPFWGSFQQMNLNACDGPTCCVNRFATSVNGVSADARVIDRVSTVPDLGVPKVSFEIVIPEETTTDDSSTTTSEDPADDVILEDGEVLVDEVAYGSSGTTGSTTTATLEDFYIGTSLMLEEEAATLVPFWKNQDSPYLINQWGDDITEVIGRTEILVGDNTHGMIAAANKADVWLQTNNLNQANTWCVPSTESDIPTVKERNAIKSGGVAWGSVQSVVNCLNYNANNQNAFEACLAIPDAAHCSDLPRSLVPGFNPNNAPDYTPGSGYLQRIEQSAFLAKDQSAKFQQRGLYLKRIVDGVTNIRDKFRAKAVDLVIKKNALRAAFDQVKIDVGAAITTMGNDATIIYGWMGPAPKDKILGAWHVVKVAGSGINELPWIKAKKSRKKLVIVCITFTLLEYKGSVGMEVWRYDEDLATMDKFFKKTLSGNEDIGKRLLQECVDPVDKAIWCLEGSPTDCKKEDPHWRPAFIGIRSNACRAVINDAMAQSVSSRKGVHYDMPGSSAKVEFKFQ